MCFKTAMDKFKNFICLNQCLRYIYQNVIQVKNWWNSNWRLFPFWRYVLFLSRFYPKSNKSLWLYDAPGTWNILGCGQNLSLVITLFGETRQKIRTVCNYILIVTQYMHKQDGIYGKTSLDFKYIKNKGQYLFVNFTSNIYNKFLTYINTFRSHIHTCRWDFLIIISSCSIFRNICFWRPI